MVILMAGALIMLHRKEMYHQAGAMPENGCIVRNLKDIPPDQHLHPER